MFYLSFMGFLMLMILPSQLKAIPQNVGFLCDTYPTSPLCVESKVNCMFCHSIPPQLNAFGGDLRDKLQGFDDYSPSPVFFKKNLPQGLSMVETQDSDGDGFTNILELEKGSFPGDPSSKPEPSPIPPARYDMEFALRRIYLSFCGHGPTWKQVETLVNLKQISDANARNHLHEILDDCLQSSYWLDTKLPSMGDQKIRPNRSIGVDGNPFVIGDYNYDYRLFTYILSGDRDIRELLTAQYFIDENGKKTYEIIPDKKVPGRTTVANGQLLEREKRAGMITTQWFISTNTMFAKLPRNTASQSYRAYLGLDIAKSQGLFPIEGEPRDVDSKGVAIAECAVCHSTLDPLAYTFANFNGLGGSGQDPVDGKWLGVGAYNPERTPWESEGALFGEPILDLQQWIEVAINSDAFKENTLRMIYEGVLNRLPETSAEKIEYQDLWQRWPEVNYQFDGMLHLFVDSLAFGGIPNEVN